MKIDAVAGQKTIFQQPLQNKSARKPDAMSTVDNSEVVVISEEGKRNHILSHVRGSLSSVKETGRYLNKEEGPVDTVSTPSEGE